MSSRATVDLSSGRLVLYNVSGWLNEEVWPLKFLAAMPFIITVGWALQCSLVGFADAFWKGTGALLVPVAGFGSTIFYLRGLCIVADTRGMRRDKSAMPVWLRPLAPSWSFRWAELQRLEIHERVKGLGSNMRTFTEMELLLRNGQRIRIRPHDWLAPEGMREQPSLQTLKCLPAVATPLGQALQQWSPVARGEVPDRV